MDVLRRNTDYALRAMVHLARHWGDGSVSTKDLADSEKISYDLACKLLQKLAGAKLVKSRMGPKGGFELKKEPGKVSIKEIIESVQGPVFLNKCLMGDFKCPLEERCPVNKKLSELQEYIDGFFNHVTLANLLEDEDLVKGKRKARKKK
ncbi:MAG: Rrf2 family transcriptional regulator [Sedimentisphaerales bacterium]|nr:Rrf2 family transcriptional regulator [Sedimentisphaerales bacterium]